MNCTACRLLIPYRTRSYTCYKCLSSFHLHCTNVTVLPFTCSACLLLPSRTRQRIPPSIPTTPARTPPPLPDRPLIAYFATPNPPGKRAASSPPEDTQVSRKAALQASTATKSPVMFSSQPTPQTSSQTDFNSLISNPHANQDIRSLAQILQTQFNDLNGRLQQYNDSSSNRLSRLENQMHTLRTRVTDEDPCEIRFKGIPNSDSSTFKPTLVKLLSLLDIPDVAAHIIHIRPWTFTPPHSTATPDPNTSTPLPTSIVARFSSPSVRNFVLSRKPQLRELSFKDISSDEPPTPIYMDCLTSPYIHQLTLKARALAKRLGLPGPRSRGNKIFMRISRSAPETEIFNEEDLLLVESSIATNGARSIPNTSHLTAN